MAEVVTIDIPGIGLVDARNAASEKTLSEILKLLENWDKKLKPGGPGAPGVPGAPSTSRDDDKNKGESGGLKRASNFLTSKIKFVGGAFVGLGEASTRAVGSLANLGDSLESVAGLFANIPIAGSLFQAAAGAAERVVRSFNDAAQSGATFGGSLNSFAGAASQAGMTLSEFGSLIRSSGQGMLAFGGTVEAGAKRFVAVSKQLRATGSDLYALGFSTQEINKGLASYGELLRLQGQQGRKSNADLVAGASRYLKNLDALSKITGEERAAKEAEMKALLQSAQFQAAMAGLSEDVRESFMLTVGQLPKGMQKFAEDIMATGTATTEENQKLLAMMPQSAALLTEFHAKQQRGEAITLEERNRLNNLMKREGGAALQSIKQAGAANAELAPLVNSLASTYQINTDAVKEATEEQKAAKEATDKVNEAVNKMKQRIAEVSNAFTMFLVNSGALDQMMKAFELLVGIIQKFAIPVINLMMSVITVAIDVISRLASVVLPILTEAFGFLTGGLTSMMNTVDKNVNPAFKFLGEVSQTVSNIIEEYVKPALLTLAAFVIADVVPVLQTLREWFTYTMEVIRDHVWPAMQTLGQVIADYVYPVFETVATFIANNLQPILLALGVSFAAYKIALMAKTAKTWLASVSLTALATKVMLAALPFIKLAIPVLALVGIFTYLYKTGWSFGTALEAVKDNLNRFWLTLVDAVNGLLSIIPNALGGISREEAQRRKAANDALRKELDEREAARDKEREETAKGRSDEAKSAARQNAVKDMSFKLDQRRLGQQQDQIRAAEKEQELALGDPYALLKGLAEKEKSDLFINQKREQFASEKAAADKQLLEAKTTAEKQEALNKIKAAEKKIEDLERAIAERRTDRSAQRTPDGSAPGTQRQPDGSTPGTQRAPAELSNYLKTIALIESGGDPTAKAKTSSASGMFQFTEGTWKQMVKEMGKEYTLQDRFDPRKAEEVAAYFTSKQKGQLEKGIGRQASSTDLYMSHFLGAGGATKFLNAMSKDPSQSAAALDPRAAAANKSIYYDREGRERTVQEVYALMDKKVKGAEQRVAEGKINQAVASIGQFSGQSMASVESARTAMINEAERRNTESQRQREEQLRRQEQQAQTQTAESPQNMPAQETLLTAINTLNTNVERMIAQQAKSNDLLDSQLRVQETFSGNMSGDLFAA